MRAWMFIGIVTLASGCNSTNSKCNSNANDATTRTVQQLATQPQTETTYVPYTVYVPYTRTVGGSRIVETTPMQAPMMQAPMMQAPTSTVITQPTLTQPSLVPPLAMPSNTLPPISGAIPIAPMQPNHEPTRPLSPRDISTPIPMSGQPTQQLVNLPISPSVVPPLVR
jgi:hypothetical protein